MWDTEADVDAGCPYCTCCTLHGCYRGEDSDCPYDVNGLRYLCPCTEE